ncbi:ATP-binding cassette domain-containing protein [Gemmatimonas sp.]|jgi:fructose transport system ATP-binding protein|uniref:ATP-binding cassette domain-containing protein n=1 Tax=Gemmatimonas sp. TaxID=1962908 RepID=UPI0037BFE39A
MSVAPNAPVVLRARDLRKQYGQVVALDGADFDVRAGEILAVIGDNGAGKSSLIKALSGALVPDSGTIELDGKRVDFTSPADARAAGIETVYQDLALAPAMSITDNLFLGRELRRPGALGTLLRWIDRPRMQQQAAESLAALGVNVRSITQAVETLSGGQRQGIAVARSAAFARHVVILDEPTAALGVRESGMVLDLIQRVRARGLSVVLISHNMPHVFQLADRLHIQRLGRRVALADTASITMADAVAIMTGGA